MKGDATVRTTNEKYRDGYDAIDWRSETPMDPSGTTITLKAGGPSAIATRRECGCLVMKGWRCQYHGDP